MVSSLPMAGEAHSGVSYYSKNLAEALARCGLAVVVLAEQGHPIRSGNPAVSSTWLPGFSYPRAIVGAVRKLKIATVLVEHTPFLYGGGPGSIFAFPVLLALLRLCGCRVVTDLHDVRPLRTIDAEFTKAVGLTVPALFVRLAFKLLFGSIALCSHRLIVHDPTTARTLVEDYGARAKAVDAVALLPPTVTVQERAQAREALAIPKRARCLPSVSLRVCSCRPSSGSYSSC